eukprot:1639665-Pyramimonas_sp.AAC.1
MQHHASGSRDQADRSDGLPLPSRTWEDAASDIVLIVAARLHEKTRSPETCLSRLTDQDSPSEGGRGGGGRW